MKKSLIIILSVFSILFAFSIPLPADAKTTVDWSLPFTRNQDGQFTDEFTLSKKTSVTGVVTHQYTEDTRANFKYVLYEIVKDGKNESWEPTKYYDTVKGDKTNNNPEEIDFGKVPAGKYRLFVEKRNSDESGFAEGYLSY